MDRKRTVLIVEDEKNIVDILRFNMNREGYETIEAYDGETGLALARAEKPDLILLDVMLPKMIGFDVCRALRAEGDNVPKARQQQRRRLPERELKRLKHQQKLLLKKSLRREQERRKPKLQKNSN